MTTTLPQVGNLREGYWKVIDTNPPGRWTLVCRVDAFALHSRRADFQQVEEPARGYDLRAIIVFDF